MPSFIKEKIAERKAKQEDGPGRSAEAPGRHRGRSEEAKAKADNVASRHKERAKGISKSRRDGMKQPMSQDA